MYIHSPTLQESEVSVCFSLQSVCSQCTTSSCLRPRFRSVDDPRCICAANADPDADLAGSRAAACVFLCLEVKSYTPILPSSLLPFFPSIFPTSSPDALAVSPRPTGVWKSFRDIRALLTVNNCPLGGD